MAGESGVRRFFRGVGRVFSVLRTAVANLLFLVFLIVVLVLIFGGPGVVQVPDGGALVLAPRGAIVEQRTTLSPVAQLTGAGIQAETRAKDILDALERAATDERIRSIVLDLTQVTQVSPAHLQGIGDALDVAREQGKEVLAIGELYTQPQYALASHADVVYLHPMGQIVLPGYGGNMLFYRDLVEKLKVNINVFRVGDYKAAVEPFTRNDLSPEARENNQTLADELWDSYLTRVAQNRNLSPAQLADYANGYALHARHAGGDLARVALEHGLVDDLMTRDAFRSYMVGQVGEENGSFRQIGFHDYLRATGSRTEAPSDSTIGVITAQGIIQMGEQPRGSIGADSLGSLIRQARLDDRVRALVVRIDTPGGSAFASEQIRQELELTQMAGKPVVVSMAGTAASGGYWIAATADEIWASEATITGSIGIFGLIPTFEDSLAEIGVYSDGIGTTPLSRGADPLAGLGDEMSDVIQANLEFGYQQFLNLVARGRDLEPGQAGDLAQGQVYSGRQALSLGLVDQLGGLTDAIAAAARLADIETWQVREIERPLTAGEQILLQLTDSWGLSPSLTQFAPPVGLGRLAEFNRRFDELRRVAAFADPMHLHSLCEHCWYR